MGISGRIAALFVDSRITPLLAIVALLLGLFAVLVTPREEEPQIDVTFANVFIPFPGAPASEVERLVTTPAEQVLSEIEGIKHIYSVSRPGMAVLTIRFRVGEDNTEAVVRLYNKVFSNRDWFPQALGVGQPVIKPRGIDDVPVVTFTLWSNDAAVGAFELARVSHALESELKRVHGARDVYTVGAPEQAVHVLVDPARLAGHDLSLSDLRAALGAANVSADVGDVVSGGASIEVRAGNFLVDADQLGELVVGIDGVRPVHLDDVADIVHGPYPGDTYVKHAFVDDTGQAQRHPAVTLAIAKKPGVNAVDLADELIDRMARLQGVVIPDNMTYAVTRNYGESADHKAKTLILKLAFATGSVILLVLLTMTWRESLIVGAAVVVTLAATLFASWAVGFTINRVSLFALIFSIGILVDDAIVVVENIHRRLHHGARSLLEKIPAAVDEVGGPTILATFTVIAALLPMAFVSGLMGPYMSPIPINASMGMLISLMVAFVITPWLSSHLLKPAVTDSHDDDGEAAGRLHRMFDAALAPFIASRRARFNRWLLAAAVILLIAASIVPVYTRSVVLKMLPFDDKSELQVVVDLAEGETAEQTARVLDAVGNVLAGVEEVTGYQAYAGTASPIGFNGLVRQYYLRESPHQGDVQVALAPAGDRGRKSHDVARDIRERLKPLAQTFDAAIKVVEVPPGPPVLAPLLAEVYGFDDSARRATANAVREVFQSTDGVVDIDDTLEYPAPRLVVSVDRARAAMLGISQADVVGAISTLVGGEDVTYLRDTGLKYAVPIRLELPVAGKADLEQLLAVKLRSRDGALVPLSEVASLGFGPRESTIHHKDLLPVVYVMGDMAGELDSPLYGMFEMFGRIANMGENGGVEQRLISAPDKPYADAIKWDGEWQITYETFRDMGLAYLVGIILIYLLVVAWFGSYLTPLVIMAPIPLTIIGVLPGHALLGAQFTATSMIGMIALAGIIVRNSILLVDFIEAQVNAGADLAEATVLSGAVRARPIVLTGVAAMMGAMFILDDPIFNGLAVSLIFGIVVSTALTLFIIPLLYYLLRRRIS